MTKFLRLFFLLFSMAFLFPLYAAGQSISYFQKDSSVAQASYEPFSSVLTPSNSMLVDIQTSDSTRWTESWNFYLNGSQASYSNWQQGGVNSLALTASTLLKLRYHGDIFANTSRMDLKYGQTRLEDEGVRKTDDLLKLSNKTEYFLTNEILSAFLEVDFHTQFTKGYRSDQSTVVSDFMSPGYFTESIGLSYQPVDYFSSQLGVGLKQTFVTIDGLDQFYGLDEDEDIRSEGGITIVLKMDKDFAKEFNYYGELSTFTNLLIPISSTDIRFSNELSGKINDTISANLQVEIFYDDDITSKLQMKQILSIGVGFALF